MADNSLNNLVVGLSAANQARAEADVSRQRAVEAERRARAAELDALRAPTDADLKRNLSDAIADKLVAQDKLEEVRGSLSEKDAQLTEWMHSNDAFKMVCKQYAETLGLTLDQIRADLSKAILQLAAENPKYAKTEIGERYRESQPTASGDQV